MGLPLPGFHPEIYAKKCYIEGVHVQAGGVEDGVYVLEKLFNIPVIEDLIKHIIEGNQHWHLNQKWQTPGGRVNVVLFIKIHLRFLEFGFVILVLLGERVQVGLELGHLARTFKLRLHKGIEDQADDDRHPNDGKSQWSRDMKEFKKFVERDQDVYKRPD